MPVQKKPILFDLSKFESADQTNSPQKLENFLMELMSLFNEFYDEIYLKYKNKPDIEKFNNCRLNFCQIKTIIESKKDESIKNYTPLIQMLYLEAWISTLYSDKHALNLQPETEEQLNTLSQKIQTISYEFKQLSTKRSILVSNNKKSFRLRKYIDDFEHFWKTDEKKLLADATFNFAETLIEHSNFQLAIDHFESAKNLYEEAAANTANNPDKKSLLESCKQTLDRLQEIKNKHFESLVKELRIRLQRIPNSASKWTISNESSSIQSTKEKHTIDVKNFNDKISLSSKIKRKSNEELTYLETKKQKKDQIDSPTTYPKKIKFRWKIECEQLLKKFDEITIENYKLPNSSPNQHELIRFKASLASQHANNVIEKLIFTNEKLNDTKKLDYLKEAERAFQNSISFYNQAGLIREKGKIISCQNTLVAIINEFKTSIYMEKLSIKPKVISRASKTSLFKPKNIDLEVYQPTSPKPKDSLPINTEKHPTKTVIPLSNEKFREYQHTYLTRYAQNFFRAYSLEQNSNYHQNLKIAGP